MSPTAAARLAGVLYLVTFVTSIPALALKTAFFDGGDVGAARAGAALEILLAIACVGTALALRPALRDVEPTLSLGFVASRVAEAGLVMLGVAALLAVTTVPSAAMVALHDAAFLLGPGLLPAVNALLLGTALWRTRLVPRVLPAIACVGAPLLLLSVGLTLAGVLDQVSPAAGLLALPIAAWELGLGLWLTARGVRRGTLTAPALVEVGGAR